MWSIIINNIRKLDWILLISVFLLFCVGLAGIYSVSLGQKIVDFSNFEKQLVFGLIGFIVLIVIALSNYSALYVYSKIVYVASFFLLVGVLFFGSVIRGTKGWFSIFGLGFQPVELAKIALLIGLAKFFSNRLQQFKIGKHVFISFCLMMLFVLPVLLQPDLGSAIVLMAVWFALLVLTGIPKKFLIVILLVFVIVCTTAWFFFLHDYQKERIMVFINPQLDPLGGGYNVSQSIIAIGSGQILGRGLGFGSQSQLKFIPESQTDFLFAVIAEELGLLGVALVLALWAIIFYRLILIARRAKDDFGMFLVLGIAIVLFIHLLINVGMNMGIMPVTGISLPFLSYGGSFLLISLIMIGIAESVAVRK